MSFDVDRVHAELSGLDTSRFQGMQKAFLRLRTSGNYAFSEIARQKGIIDSFRVGYIYRDEEAGRHFFAGSVVFKFTESDFPTEVSLDTSIVLGTGDNWRVLISLSNLLCELASSVSDLERENLRPQELYQYLKVNDFVDVIEVCPSLSGLCRPW